MLDDGVVELLFVSARLEIERAKQREDRAKQAESYRRAIDTLTKIETHHRAVPTLSSWIAASWRGLGEKEKAEAADAQAEASLPRTALDYFVQGECYAQQADWEKALESYWKALNRDSGHFLSLLAAGVALVELERYEAAETMLTGAIAVNPVTTLAYVKRGTSRMEQGKLALGQFDFDTANELDPELAEALLRRGIAHYWENSNKVDLQDALADLTEAIRLRPDHYQAYLNRGNVYIFLRRYEKALADQNEAIRLEPGAGCYANRANTYSDLGEYDKAIADCDKAIEVDPKHVRAHGVRGMIHAHLGNFDKAIADANTAVDLAANEGAFARARAYSIRGSVYETAGEIDKAMADLNEAVRLNPSDAGYYNDRAIAYYKQGDLKNAISDFNEAIRLNPRVTEVYSNRGYIYLRMGDYDNALADFEQAVRLNPEYSGPYTNRGILWSLKGEYDRAIADYDVGIRLGQTGRWRTGGLDDSYCYFLRGWAYLENGEPEKAVADCNEAIRLNPKRGEAYCKRAQAHARLGQIEEARRDLDRAEKADPKNANAMNEVAWALLTFQDPQLRDADRAIELATRAVKVSPNEGAFWGTLGVAQFRTGDWKGAIEALDRANERRLGGCAADWLFLAMAHWQLGNQVEARRWYDKAVEWIDKNAPGNDLRRFRAEAEELMGVMNTTPKGKEQAK